jgi:two-component system, NtrC family, nitrogen regulation sensor histidine kinase NtrY
LNARQRSGSTPPRPRMATDLRLFLLVLSSAVPVTVLLAWLLADSTLPAAAKAAIAVACLMWILVVSGAARGELLRHVRTLSNLVESIRTQDYSMKGSRARESGEVAELYQQINSLTDSLKSSRQSEQELLSILDKVVSQINVAIVVCDSHNRIRLVNRLATALLKSSADELLGVNITDTVLAQFLDSTEPRLVDLRFPGAEGRWQITQHHYRHQGQASRIVFIADLRQVLSDEEIAAWQRLIRVIGHEVNNSLTPITSLCQTLAGMLAKPDSAAYAADVREGLGVIADRARGLQEFISVYARLARLPEPHKVPFAVADLAAKLQRFFSSPALEITPFPQGTVFGDPVHLEQALINLIKNAVEANPAGAPAVQLSCHLHEGQCEFRIVDHGPGIGNPQNLFVPFYTTKPGGAGIGLILCRQIAAGHHGRVTLESRSDGPGAVARLTLPLPPGAADA